MMITLVKISDMREVALVDLDQMSQDQGLTLATAVADLLIRSGTTRDDVPLSGPQLLQFLSELGDHLAAQRVAADATERDDAFEEAIVGLRSEEHTSELQSLMRISYAVFCLKKKRQ